MFRINKSRRSGYDPKRPVLSSVSFQLPMRLALAVVFLASNMVRGAILCRTHPGPFPFRHGTIGLCLSSILFTCSCCLFSLFASRSFSCPLAIP